jgi:hypothetical protein
MALYYGAVLVALIATVMALGVMTARIPTVVLRSPAALTQ